MSEESNERVLRELEGLSDKLDSLGGTVTEVRIALENVTVRIGHVEAMAEQGNSNSTRISKLETFRAKVTGYAVGAATVTSGAVTGLGKFFLG